MNPIEKLAKIKDILNHEERKTFEDGKEYTCSNHAYYELDGALYDIEHRTIDTDIEMGFTKLEDTYKIDKCCIDTIKRVQKQIAEVMKLLDEPITYEDPPAPFNRDSEGNLIGPGYFSGETRKV